MATFSDAQLIIIIQKAARRINRRLALTGTTNEISINSTTGEVSSPNDEDIKDIVLLQAECMMSGREFQDSMRSGDGLSITDGEQKIDSRQAADSRSKFFDSEHSPCSELEKAINIYNIQNTSGRCVW